MRVATWNTKWAGPRSPRFERISAKLADLDADVLVITEGQQCLLPPGGHVIDAGSAWGYGEEPHRRKVLAWSRRPWREVRCMDEGAARGRVLAGTTESDDGPVGVIAVCIPWSHAHVSTGRGTALGWAEHIECCAQLSAFRRTLDPSNRSLIAGDFNQRLPRVRQPVRAFEALEAAMAGMTIWTAGDTPCGQLIDHIAGSSGLAAEDVQPWAAGDAIGSLSDHAGVACTVRAA